MFPKDTYCLYVDTSSEMKIIIGIESQTFIFQIFLEVEEKIMTSFDNFEAGKYIDLTFGTLF